MMNNSNILYKICKAILILSIVVSIIIVTDYLFRVRIENIKSDLEKKRSVIIKVDKNKPKIIESPIIYDNNKNTSIKKPKIAIIVIGLGLSKFSTEKVFKLSNKITLGFSIYSHNINKWINKAKIKNHDILISLPMEPEDYPISDPGSLALMSDNLVSDNLKTLKEIIYKADYKYGVYTPINERFSFNIYNMTPILRELKRNNLSVIYSNQKDNSQLILNAKKDINIPILTVQKIIDHNASPQYIKANLKYLEEYAIKHGYAVGIIRAYPSSIDQIYDWSNQLLNKNIQLVNISNIFNIITK